MTRQGTQEQENQDKEKDRPKRPHISDALKSEVWKRDCGNVFWCKCPIPWCTTQVEYTNCVLAHNIPWVKGGATTLDNLRITCARCNLGMGSTFTVDEWISRGTSRGLPPFSVFSPTTATATATPIPTHTTSAQHAREAMNAYSTFTPSVLSVSPVSSVSSVSSAPPSTEEKRSLSFWCC